MSTHLNETAILPIMTLIQNLERQALQYKKSMVSIQSMIIDLAPNSALEIVFMLKNKFGMSKKDAQKLFFDYRKKDTENAEPEPGNQPPQREAGTSEEKISMIMDYMRDTSVKLDRIEEDISFLKVQVEEILKRI